MPSLSSSTFQFNGENRCENDYITYKAKCQKNKRNKLGAW